MVKELTTKPEAEKLKFELHKYQRKIMRSPKRFLIALAGIQSGKTMVGCMWLISEILRGWNENKDYSYLIAAPTYKILQQSTLRKWFEVAPPWLGRYLEQKSVIQLADGRGIIYIRSTDEPYGLEGMTLKAAWLDEGGQMPDEVWRVIQGRLSILRGRCLITSTPYAFNWLKDVSDAGTTDDTLVVHWESIDSPWFPRGEYLRQLKIAKGDPSLMADFEKRYRGIFRSMTGAVYQNWNEKFTTSDLGSQYFKEYIGGIDWGYTQPFAIEIMGFSDTKPTCVLVDEYYQSGKTIDELAQIAANMKKQWNVRLFYADPSRPDYIMDFNTRGIPVMPGNNDIQMGISVIQRLIKSGNFAVHTRCHNLLEEIKKYHYPEVGDSISKEIPVKVFDHALDSMRYAIATHLPAEIPVEKIEKPIWTEIKESLKEQNTFDEAMDSWDVD